MGDHHDDEDAKNSKKETNSSSTSLIILPEATAANEVIDVTEAYRTERHDSNRGSFISMSTGEKQPPYWMRLLQPIYNFTSRVISTPVTKPSLLEEGEDGHRLNEAPVQSATLTQTKPKQKKFFKKDKQTVPTKAQKISERTFYRVPPNRVDEVMHAHQTHGATVSERQDDLKNSRHPVRFVGNRIRTSKYTIYTFIPKNLCEQFRRIANFYFLVLILLQIFPQINMTNPGLAAVPIVIIVSMTAAKDGFEDYRRHKSDNAVNMKSYTCLRAKQYATVKCEDLKVGDYVVLTNNENVPADLVVLTTSDPNQVCYVETKNLDGETNLKVVQSALALDSDYVNQCKEREHFLDLGMTVHIEAPSTNLYKCSGYVDLDRGGSSLRKRSRDLDATRKPAKFPVNITNMLLRGSTLRNTPYVVGIVVYTGPDTKLMLNSGRTPSKRTRIERKMNPQIVLAFVILAIMSLVCASIVTVFVSRFPPNTPFMLNAYSEPTALLFLITFAACIIIFQGLIPISLYVTIELVKTLQALFIHEDLQMYYEPTQQRCMPRSWTLSDDLGQIEFVFSDKTGTLTRNEMVFKCCSVAGEVYGEIDHPENSHAVADTDGQHASQGNTTEAVFHDARLTEDLKTADESSVLYHFFMLLSICHTVLVERKSSDHPPLDSEEADKEEQETERHVKDHPPPPASSLPDKIFFTPPPAIPETLVYQAQSPDEAALVAAARDVGFVFFDRTQDRVGVRLRGTEQRCEILNLLAFTSDRKRMSVVVRFPTGALILYTKGADSVLYERLDKTRPSDYEMKTLLDLEDFASQGLRTLVCAYRVLDETVYQAWNERYTEAMVHVMVDREAVLAELAEELECGLILLGATAIEDKLQEGVPETIEMLMNAGMKLWVLTGDKQETAINIGFSCRLLQPEDDLLVIRGSDSTLSSQGVADELTQAMAHIRLVHSMRRRSRKPGDDEEEQEEENENGGQSERALSEQHSHDDEDDSDDNSEDAYEYGRHRHRRHSYRRSSHPTESPSDEAMLTRDERRLSLYRRDINTSNISQPVSFRTFLIGADPSSDSFYASREAVVDAAVAVATAEEAPRETRASWVAPKGRTAGIPRFSLVIDGAALKYALDRRNRALFLEVALRCSAVICCRASPLQKAQVVHLVKVGRKAMTLAIGDGANDVSMIQEAHVGVGISGVEGMQAVMASDYSIAQFRFLARLVLVHGHWSYYRISRMVLLFFYKNVVSVMPMFLFQIYCGFNGQSVYQSTFAMFYNLIFTSLPVSVLGLFDKDVSDRVLLRFPQLYRPGLLQRRFTTKIFWLYVVDASWQGLVCFFVPFFLWSVDSGVNPQGKAGGLWEFGAVINTLVIVNATLFVALQTKYWTWMTHAALWLSLLFWYGYVIVYTQFRSQNVYGTGVFLYSQVSFWFVTVISIPVALGPRYLVKCLLKLLKPSDTDILREAEKYKLDKYISPCAGPVAMWPLQGRDIEIAYGAHPASARGLETRAFTPVHRVRKGAARPSSRESSLGGETAMPALEATTSPTAHSKRTSFIQLHTDGSVDVHANRGFAFSHASQLPPSFLGRYSAVGRKSLPNIVYEEEEEMRKGREKKTMDATIESDSDLDEDKRDYLAQKKEDAETHRRQSSVRRSADLRRRSTFFERLWGSRRESEEEEEEEGEREGEEEKEEKTGTVMEQEEERMPAIQEDDEEEEEEEKKKGDHPPATSS